MMKMQETTRPSMLALLMAFAAVYFIWGSTYLAIRFAIETIPPFLMAGIRFLSAGAILFLGTIRSTGLPSRIEWRSAFIVGFLLLVSGNGFLTWAELYVPSGVAALIVATVPLWMVILGALAPGGSRPSMPVIFGLFIGLAGIVILIGPNDLGGERIHVPGALMICLAAFSWALGSIYSRRAPQSESTLMNVGMQMLLGGAVLLIGGLVLGERLDLHAISSRSGWSLVYLSLIGGVVSYSAYVWLLKVSTPARVSTYAYVNPLVAVFLGWSLGGEALDPKIFVATTLVVAAVFLITWTRRAPAEKGS